jgi:hypothetical protein
MSRPQTLEELIDWFTPGYDINLIKKFVEVNSDLSISRIWNIIIDRNLAFNDSKSGWVDREGGFYGCSFAGHEFLLDFMGSSV